MLTLIVSLLIPASLVVLFRFLNARHKSPIFGMYQQRNKGYWVKFVVFYIFLRVKQLLIRLKRFLAVESGRSGDGTIQIHEQDAVLEKKYNLGQYPLAVDGVYFNGMSKNGVALVCGVARRAYNTCDAFMFLKVDGEELLLTPSLPDTHLTQNEEEIGEYKVQGISITNFIPMRTWKLSYSGELKTKNDAKKKVELSVTWSAHWYHFNYDMHISASSLASSVATERWSSNFFQLLDKFHQTHYEQMGYIEGTVSIDGKEHNLTMPCVRDHTFGNFRNWRNFHRYVYHFIFLENGDCIAVGSVSQSVTISHLTIGYVCLKVDPIVVPVDYSDFLLYQHGENETLPNDYGFTFKAGGESYAVKVLVDNEDIFYIGKDRESKFYERWCTVEVNGVKGWACVEWQYNNTRQG